ncbi:hypothetical protein [Robertmurraya sp. Marseille-Q9965]
MFIKNCSGYELEKEKPNTSEDFFNRSVVTFQEDGIEKTFQVLYLRYFDEVMGEFTPYKQDPLFQIGDRAVYFKDIVAIVCLIKNPGFRHRKRVYFNAKQEFASFFNDVDFEKVKTIFEGLEQNNGYELRSPLEFIQ